MIKIMRVLGVLVVSSILFSACAAERGTGLVRPGLEAEARKGYTPNRTNRVAVFPLVAERESDVATEQLASLTERLVQSLEAGTSLELENVTSKEKVKQLSHKQAMETGTLREKAQRFGKAIGSQGVLYGIVTSYQERSSRFGGDTLAHASFRLWLIDTETGELLWLANFDKREQPLSENLFRVQDAFKGGIGYRSVVDLFDNGFREVAQDLERLRRST